MVTIGRLMSWISPWRGTRISRACDTTRPERAVASDMPRLGVGAAFKLFELHILCVNRGPSRWSSDAGIIAQVVVPGCARIIERHSKADVPDGFVAALFKPIQHYAPRSSR